MSGSCPVGQDKPVITETVERPEQADRIEGSRERGPEDRQSHDAVNEKGFPKNIQQ